MIGTTLQHYRIVRSLGAGGMGEVYEAEDVRLHRHVALKLLPSDTALDPERLQRFQREAQAVAALNHPNVVTLYGVEQAGGRHFLTMELVDGKTLADLIPPRGFPLPLFLKLAVQIVDAVGAAHQRGIVHRDLKPANVMVRPDGCVKVLDFGLAKLKPGEPPAGDDATRTTPELTKQHKVMGTAAYMSPEQAEGRPVDARTDIFSLGVLLYEMATGSRPFRGDSAISILSSIIKDTPPPPSDIVPGLPREVDRAVRRCLAKEPERRYQHAADLRQDLEDLLHDPAVATSASRGWTTSRRAAVAVMAAVALGVAGFVAYRVRTGLRAPSQPPRLELTQLTANSGVEWFPSLSPDGKWIVYAAEADGARHIFLQSLTGDTRMDLTPDSTWDEDQPAFSPDGERIAFRSSREGGGIFVMGRTGEAVRRLTRAGFKPAWSPDGNQLAYTTENVEVNPQNAIAGSELWVVTIATQEARRISTSDAVLAAWSPHNRRIAYTQRLGRPPQGDILTIPAGGGEAVPVTQGFGRGWYPAWSPDGGYLYFVSDRSGAMNLWRIRIDEASGKVQGEPEPITTPALSLAHPAISADGTRIAYSSTSVTANIQQLTLDPVAAAVKGEPVALTTGSRRWSSPDPSPDGQWVAFYSLTQPEGDLYIARADGTRLRQVTTDVAIDRLPRWSPDGQWIACFSNRTGRYEVWKIRPDGSEQQQVTGEGGTYFAWSPDGARMAVVGALEEMKEVPVWIFDPRRPWKDQRPLVLPPHPDPERRLLVNSWSPDGTRLIGQDRLQRTGISMYSLDSRTYDHVVDFGEWPVWLPDSRRALFVADGNAFHVVDTRTKSVKKIYSVRRDVIGPPRLTRDGRTAVFSRRVTESDIWLATIKQ